MSKFNTIIIYIYKKNFGAVAFILLLKTNHIIKYKGLVFVKIVFNIWHFVLKQT